MASVSVILLMCWQDPLAAVTDGASNCSKARKIGMLDVNMLTSRLNAANKPRFKTLLTDFGHIRRRNENL